MTPMTVPETPDKRPFVWPAEYYASASPKALLPPWAPYGCGAGAVVVLLVVFIGGALVTSHGIAEFMDFAVGMSVSEMRGQYAADVTAAQKKSLEAEIDRLRAHLREERITVAALQPFFELLRAATSDKKLTAPEAANLEAAARHISRYAKASAPAKPNRTDTTTGH
jgi:hypothetical protein